MPNYDMKPGTNNLTIGCDKNFSVSGINIKHTDPSHWIYSIEDMELVLSTPAAEG